MADESRLSIMMLALASSVHTAVLAATLADQGHRVLVASWQPGPDLPGVDLRVAPAVGAPVARRAPLAAAWLRRLVGEARPQVVHVHSLGTYGLLSLALPRGPARVLTPWGSEIRAAQHSGTRAAVIRQALRQADMVLPCSPDVAAEVTGRYAVPSTQTQVFSWGVAADLIAAHPAIDRAAVRSDFGLPRYSTVVLSMRSTAATYRTQEIVDAFALAAPDRPDLFLVLLGGHRPAQQAALRAKEAYVSRVRAAARPVADRVLIVDQALSRQRTFELMCASDVAISVPPGDSGAFSVLEAALAGCRLVLSDIPPYQVMVRRGLTADLLAEPIVAALASHLRGTAADRRSGHSNQEFILTQEHGARQVAALARIYRRLTKDGRIRQFVP